MADLKISQLTGATTPLAGTEVVPIVQSSTTRKVSIANLTAGRSVGMQQANIAAAAGGGIGNPAWVADDGTGAMRLAFLAAPYAGVPAGKPWLHSYQDIYIGSDAGITVNFVSGGTTVSFDSGNLRVGAATTNGDLANTKSVTGGLFNTFSGTTVSLAGGATEDIAGLLSGAAYLVACRGTSNTTTFVIHTVYLDGAGGVTLATLSNGNGFVLTSPANNTLRITGLVTTQTYQYTLTRIF